MNLTAAETAQCTDPSVLKLPNIDLPNFNDKDFAKYGVYFIDMFTAVIQNKKSRSDVQIFYL